MAIIATLLTIALPRYFGSVEKSKEVTLRQSLNVMRDAIDKFYADNGRYPDKLEELVEKRYIRAVPVDPITDSPATWVLRAVARRRREGRHLRRQERRGGQGARRSRFGESEPSRSTEVDPGPERGCTRKRTPQPALRRPSSTTCGCGRRRGLVSAPRHLSSLLPAPCYVVVMVVVDHGRHRRCAPAVSRRSSRSRRCRI